MAFLSMLLAPLSYLDSTSLVVFLLVFLAVYYWASSPKNLPPGPMGLPLVGNIFAMKAAGSNLMEQIKEWRQQYGDIFTLRIGSRHVVIISDYKMMQEAFVKNGDIFSGRPHNLYMVNLLTSITGIGVINNDGPAWKELRRVTLMTMRDFGMGKKSIQQRIQDETRAVMEVIDQGQGQHQGHTMVVKLLLAKFASNVICSIIFGDRFAYTDPVFNDLLRMVDDLIANSSVFAPVNFLSVLRVLPSMKKAIAAITLSGTTISKHVADIVGEHETTFDPSQTRSFVDLYLKTKLEQKDAHYYTASNMRRVIIDLLIAGTETSATTVDWAILYLIANPEVQRRCQEQLDQVIGQNRLVTMDDKQHLPYIEAVITEVMRIAAIVPLVVPHMTTKEGVLGGYTIPANTIVLANISSMHYDPEDFPQPETFDPQRFLNKEGQFCPPKRNYAPFSIGPRVCLGESLAKMEVFILFCSLIQFYTFSMPQGQTPDLQGHMGIVFTAKKQQIVITRRAP